MTRKQTRITKFFLAIFLFSLAFAFTPVVFAQNPDTNNGAVVTSSERGVINGLIPCGRRGDPNQDPAAKPCTACHAVLAGKNLIDYLTSIMVVVAIAVIVGMGVLYIVSGVNENLKKTAKAGLTAVLVGLVLMLSAWLIVSTVLRFLASPALIQGNNGFIGLSSGRGVFGLQCDTTSQGGQGELEGGRIVSRGAGIGGTGGAGAGNGTCSVLTGSNPCSATNLQNTCFGSQASRISQLCNLESRGQPNIRSGTDVCGNQGNRSFSGGLFQINIFDHGARLGADCANLGNKGRSSDCRRRNSRGICLDWNCTIPDVQRFDRCMARTFTAEGNIQIACAISNNGTNLTPWACSANRCGLGGTTSNFCR